MKIAMSYAALAAAVLLACACQRAAPASTVMHTADGKLPTSAAASTSRAPPTVLTAALDVDSLVGLLLEQQYRQGFDTVHACWKTTVVRNGETSHYCMRPGSPQLVDEDQGRFLYVYTASASDINDDLDYAYSAVDPGMMGAFKAQVTPDGQVKPLAAEPAMEFGSAGDCGCANAKFIRLGRDVRGWTFVSGGVWQGVPSTQHALVVFDGAQIRDVSAIPASVEAKPGLSYSLAIDASNPAADWYPISVSRNDRGGARTQVTFDKASHQYRLPSGF